MANLAAVLVAHGDAVTRILLVAHGEVRMHAADILTMALSKQFGHGRVAPFANSKQHMERKTLEEKEQKVDLHADATWLQPSITVE